jgi:CheY-like chemotaxis protein
MILFRFYVVVMEVTVKKVLIVDDNVNDRAVLAYYVSKYFLCEIYSASNGREALDRINKILPDVIITDITMPVMNGIEFIKELFRRGNDIPVIALSAVNEEEVVDQIKQMGILTYLPKPLNPFGIFESLEEVFNYKSVI